MLRVGLTGGLGSGKSTVGRLFVELGAALIDADEVGRKLMQPGESVFQEIVAHFGPGVVRPDGSLDRPALAEQAFGAGRVEELNQIVHPAVIQAQEEWLRGLLAAEPKAVAIIESALIFEASGRAGRAGSVPGWRERFDRIVLITAPDALKVQRFVERCDQGNPEMLAADARRRIAAQISDHEKVPLCDFVIDNSGERDALRPLVERIFFELQAASRMLHLPIK